MVVAAWSPCTYRPLLVCTDSADAGDATAHCEERAGQVTCNGIPSGVDRAHLRTLLASSTKLHKCAVHSLDLSIFRDRYVNLK